MSPDIDLPDSVVFRSCILKGIEHPFHKRNVAIHEAGHAIVGMYLKFPMGKPVIFDDGSGIAPFDRESLPKSEGKFDDYPEKVRKTLCLHLAAVFLAGYIAEAIAQGRGYSYRIVFAEGPDLDNARKVLGFIGLKDGNGILYAATIARNVLNSYWPLVAAYAENIATDI